MDELTTMCAQDLFDRAPDDRYQILQPDGTVRSDAEVPDLDDATLVDMYRDMRFARRFDERAVSLQRQGRIGTYPPLAGQEGSQIGSTYALPEDDWIVYQYRETGVVIVRGLTPDIVRYWMGYEEGNVGLADRHIFPINITIGDQIPHATGMGWAAKLKGDDRAVVCHFGDGATSEGDFHEALNFAGVFDTPTVFMCNNNQWAISVPRERQTAAATIAQKATAYGFEGIQVDGMDPLAMYHVTRAAREKALDEASERPRPTLIEAVQYRFGAHTTADDPTVYRDEDELERWRQRDPISRFETFLRDRGLLDDERIEAMETAIEDEIAELIDAAEATEPQPDAMFAHVYAELPARIQNQREYFGRLRERHDEDALLQDE